VRSVADSPILGFWELSSQKMRDSLPWTPMNRREKFDAARFIVGGEIRNRTYTHEKKQTNSKRCNNTLPISMCG